MKAITKTDDTTKTDEKSESEKMTMIEHMKADKSRRKDAYLAISRWG
jgi:hypothetical protein